MKRLAIIFSLLLFSAALSAQSTIRMAPEGVDCRAWAEKSFSKSKLPPFSFVYGGRESSSFIRKWKFSKTELGSGRPDETLTAYSWKDPKTGLEVVCKVKLFSDFNAMEWVVEFRNCGSANTPQIKDVKVVDLKEQSVEKGGDWTLFYSDGSHADKHDFHPMTRTFRVGEEFEMAPYGGRSSSFAFPFFNVKTPTGGIVYAIGWTGTWFAEISRPEASGMNVATGMKYIDTYLEPGEEIRTPSTAMIPWQGEDRMDGQNIFRQFLLAHHHPRLGNGEPADFPVCTSFNYGDPYPCNEYTCMTSSYGCALIKRYEQFSLVPDVFWLDAGWYEGAADWKHGYNWYLTVGNWAVDKDRFPSGLGEIADAAHEVGAKFMVWFEPERVNRSSYWCHEHPEFLLNVDGTPANVVEGITEHSHIVDLGNPEALKWMTDNVKKMIRDNRIDYYRQDYNLDPEGFFAANDKPGRRGICEIRYICGLYKFWDDLRAEFPDLIIDNCASGGRRIDLETTSRAAPLWRTDYNYGEPVGYQCHTYGLCQWLPIHGTGVASADPFVFRSSLSYCVTTNWKITNPNSNILEMQKKLAEFYTVRPYFKEDFYPLTGYENNTSNDIWIAYQLNRRSDGTGYIVAFRREYCPKETLVVKLRGLDPSAVYVIEDEDSGDTVEVSGKDLSEGYAISSPGPRSSRLLRYFKKD